MSSVNAASKNTTSVKPPKAKNAQVTLDDITSLNEYISIHGDTYLVTEGGLLAQLKKNVASNRELQGFTGLDKKLLNEAFKNAAYTGLSAGKYKVYTIQFEYTNAANDKVSVLVTYDMDRKMLIEALNISESPSNEITVNSRNVGLTFIGDRAEAMEIVNAKTVEQKKALKEKNKEKHKKEIEQASTSDKNGNIIDSVASVFSVDTASANTCSGSLNLNGAQCSWVAVGYCAAAGLFGFLPGLICAIGYTYVCNYTC
ncbi:hypothetical protein PCCS19_23080 [Paenibacillus sp. CCS19]|nr:hypothetical protein PCCS19_23080 [Paenibacillus cellulosilyticus]